MAYIGNSLRDKQTERCKVQNAYIAAVADGLPPQRRNKLHSYYRALRDAYDDEELLDKWRDDNLQASIVDINANLITIRLISTSISQRNLFLTQEELQRR